MSGSDAGTETGRYREMLDAGAEVAA